MEVVSVSMNEVLLEELDEFAEDEGYSGRSEIIRTAIRSLLRERKDLETLSGNVSGVMLTVHESEHTGDIEEIQHQFTEVISTQLHHHLENGNCTEVFIVEGKAEKIQNLQKAFQSSKRVKDVKTVIP